MFTLFSLVVGLGIFLFGMNQLELGAKELSGSKLKTWLLATTKTPLSSAGSGIFLTALLQSSSLVGLIVLAFASAGIIPLINAIGVFLGANLGTTLTGWIVTFLGFKLDLTQAALPMIAMGGMAQIIWQPTHRWRSTGLIVLGLGLLLFGLSIMKDSVADLPEKFSIDSLSGHHPIVYLLAGMLMTAVIQSSSAMMMIALSALHGELIALPDAAALVIGADLGTTSTVVLGALSGSSIKRSLAFAHFFFNMVVDLLAFIILLPLLPALINFLRIQDPLIALVTFHSTFNALGLMGFLPFIRPFSRWVEKLFYKEKDVILNLEKLPTKVPDAAIPVVIQAIQRLWITASELNLSLFRINFRQLEVSKLQDIDGLSEEYIESPFATRYESVKNQEGDLLKYILRVQAEPLTEKQSAKIVAAMTTIRSIVYSCKTLKDIRQNINDLQKDESHQLQTIFDIQKQFHIDLYTKILQLTLNEHIPSIQREELDNLNQINDEHHKKMDKLIYDVVSHQRSQVISSLLNMNREIHHAAKNILVGMRDWFDVNNHDDMVR